jgi:predicted AlkP superfamily pyrophosphatase or phosphodiesterase
MKKTVVIDVVGLSARLLGAHTPQLQRWSAQGRITTIHPVLPAVTCTAQATYLTGHHPNEHGIVANGWYFHDDCEVKFWRQSNKLVQRPKIWEIARSIDPEFTCANLFWWYNMYSTVDYAVTPRPLYLADGRKLPDIYTQPAALRSSLQADLGTFPLFKFWGPATSAESSQWIAAAAKRVEEQYNPTLTLIYLPHLDYCLQKVGCQPDAIAQDLRDIDAICGDLIAYYENRGAQVIVLSEYGITPVNQPIHLNRLLRQAGLLQVREELDRELLDAGASRAFAVADHQIAHVYVNDASCLDQVKQLLAQTNGVEIVLDEAGKRNYHLNHPRSGDLIAIAKPNAWFTYYYWLEDQKAPDFARTVDIHRKPGYDPAELLLDPTIKHPKLTLGWTLLKKKLGFRYLMEVIPLDATLVKGSHGHLTPNAADCPLLITRQTDWVPNEPLEATQVFQTILSHLKGRFCGGDRVPFSSQAG